MKLNAVRDFQTGIYDYNVMTSTFLRVARGWPLAKVSFSSQEWCGHVWHQLVPRGGKLSGLFHSYFDGEADGTDTLDLPAGRCPRRRAPGPRARLERRVPEAGRVAQRGRSCRACSCRGSRTSRSRGRRPGSSRAASTSTVKVPAGSFPVSVYEVEIAATASASRSGAAPGGVAPGGAATGAASQAGSRKLTFAVEAQPPFRLVRQTGGSGEQLLLLGSTRLSTGSSTSPAARSTSRSWASSRRRRHSRTRPHRRPSGGPGGGEADTRPDGQVSRGRKPRSAHVPCTGAIAPALLRQPACYTDFRVGASRFRRERDPERRRSSVPTGSLIRLEKHSCQRQFGAGCLTKP